MGVNLNELLDIDQRLNPLRRLLKDLHDFVEGAARLYQGLAEAQQRKAQVTADVEVLVGEKTRLDTALAEKRAEVEAARVEVARAKRETASLIAELHEQVQAEGTRVREEIARLQAQQEAERQKLVSLKADIEAFKRQYGLSQGG